MNVAVALPSLDRVPMGFAVDLARMYRSCSGAGIRAALCPVVGTYVHTARQYIVDNVLAEGQASHLLWIDSDMRFPPDLLQRLLLHDKDAVGVNYRMRKPPHRFVSVGLDGSVLPTDPGDGGLAEVAETGFGLLLMRAEALARTMESQRAPLFHYEWHEARRQFLGEDYYCCRKMRAAGYQLFVDHDLSRECAHIGEQEFGADLNDLIQALQAIQPEAVPA